MRSILEKFQVNELYFCVKRYPINNIKLEGVSQNLLMLNGCFKTTSSHFFASFMNSFHKKLPEVVLKRPFIIPKFWKTPSILPSFCDLWLY